MVWLEIFPAGGLFYRGRKRFGKMRGAGGGAGRRILELRFWLSVVGLGLIISAAAEALGQTVASRFTACCRLRRQFDRRAAAALFHSLWDS